jgi:CspA family cold shock protein
MLQAGDECSVNLIYYHMKTGTVKFFNESKGYGFIVSDETKKEVFVHHSGLLEKVRENDRVEFEEMEGRKGVNAVNVKRVQ